MALPDRGPYDPMYEDMEDLPNGMVHHQYPYDVKYMQDPEWYDTLGRSLVEQRKVFTQPRPGEEQVAMVRQILDECPTDPNGVGREWSVSLEAAMKGSAPVMQYLVHEKKLHVDNAPDDSSELYAEVVLASSKGHLDVLKTLVEEAGADVDVSTGGNTPLICAAVNGQTEVLRWLLDHRADLEPYEGAPAFVFGAAAVSGKLEVMETLLSTAIEQHPDKPASYYLGQMVIGQAATSGSPDMVTFVIEHAGFRKAAENSEGQRNEAIAAIPMAIRNDTMDKACLDMVIECALIRDVGGDFVRSDDEHLLESLKSAICNCCTRFKHEQLNFLLQLVLDCTTMARDSEKFQDVLLEAIHRCYDPKSEPCARVLLEVWQASPNVNDPYDRREPYPLVLQGAVSRGDVGYVRFWLDHGADVHRAYGPYCNGPTALALAVGLQNESIVRLLLEYGGPVDVKGDGLVGQKQLRVIAKGGDLDEVELMAPTDDSKVSSEGAEVMLDFDGGVTNSWLDMVQLRRSDQELAKDGSGRPLKPRA